MYIKFSPSEYVIRYKNGKLFSQGVGLSFFYLERNTSVYVIPTSNIDADFIFEKTTCDYQQVFIQGQLTYRAVDYLKLATAMDFTIDMKNRQRRSEPMQKLLKRIHNIAEVLVKSHINALTLTQAMQSGHALAEQLLAEIQNVAELRELGIQVVGFSILNISANKETARALEATTREEILKQSDDALYARRNASIEQERKVKENELNTENSVEEQKRIITETEIQTKRMVVEKENEIEKLRALSKAEREKIAIDAEIELERKRKELATLRSENSRMDADAEAYRICVTMEAYSKISAEVLVALATLEAKPEKLIAQAFEKLASNSAKIGTLNITPDLLESLKTEG